MRQGLRQGRRGKRQSLPLRWLLYLLLLLLSLEGDRMVATGPEGRVTMFGIDGVGFSDLPGRVSMPEPTAP